MSIFGEISMNVCVPFTVVAYRDLMMVILSDADRYCACFPFTTLIYGDSIIYCLNVSDSWVPEKYRNRYP